MEKSKYKEIQKKLLERRSEIHSRIEKIRKNYASPLSKDSEERAVELENAAVLKSLFRESSEEVKKINKSLELIDRDEYGICVTCGMPIPVKRLEVMPYASCCIKCASS